jgi:hypothetical protein
VFYFQYRQSCGSAARVPSREDGALFAALKRAVFGQAFFEKGCGQAFFKKGMLKKIDYIVIDPEG